MIIRSKNVVRLPATRLRNDDRVCMQVTETSAKLMEPAVEVEDATKQEKKEESLGRAKNDPVKMKVPTSNGCF
jgi:hypothetical protein